MVKRFAAGSLLALSLFLMAGCQSGKEIAVEMTNFALTPSEVEVKAGEKVTFILINRSDLEHEFESDQGKLEEALVSPGRTTRVEWQAPSEAGEYEFECDMAGHDGMVMTIRVVEAK